LHQKRKGIGLGWGGWCRLAIINDLHVRVTVLLVLHYYPILAPILLLLLYILFPSLLLIIITLLLLGTIPILAATADKCVVEILR
jgi:hypothetical protein